MDDDAPRTDERIADEYLTGERLPVGGVPEQGDDLGDAAVDEDEATPVAPEITYDEQRYPARPRRLRPRVNLRGGSLQRRFSTDPRTANGENPAYIEWLVRQSMLKDADVLSRQLSGTPAMWRNPYARPDARRAVSTARRVVHRVPDLAHHPCRASRS